MKLDLDEATMRGLVSEAILRGIDDKARDTIVKDAVTYLLKEQSDSYGTQLPAPITSAFRNAIHGVAESVVRDMVKNDESIRARIVDIAQQAFTKALESDDIVHKMALALTSGLTFGKER